MQLIATVLLAILESGSLTQARGASVDKENGTVFDTLTGLIWQQGDSQNDQGRRNWYMARDYCEMLTLANHNGWHLPNIDELKTLLDGSRQSPCIDPVFQCSSRDHWSGTYDVPCPGYARSIYVGDGLGSWGHMTYTMLDVRCVRGVAFAPRTISQTPFSGPPGTTYYRRESQGI